MQTLVSLTNDFYNKEAQSFSDTRTRPWDGWVYAMDYLLKHGLPPFDNNKVAAVPTLFEQTPLTPTPLPQTHPCDCIDVACGNLRFLDFLINYLQNNISNPITNFPSVLSYIGIDKQSTLTRLGMQKLSHTLTQHACVTIHTTDVLSKLMDEHDPLAELTQTTGMMVCFGFMHHIPSFKLRQTFLSALCEHVCRGGIIVLSFWCFGNTKHRRAKAQAQTEEALCALAAQQRYMLDVRELENNDYLLGWKHTQGVMRYAHSFSEQEVFDLIANTKTLKLLTHWYADGKDNHSNLYVIAQNVTATH